MFKLSYAITDNNITVNYNGQTHIISRSDKLADQLIDKLRNNLKEEIPDLISAAQRIEKYTNGVFKVESGQIILDGHPVHEGLSRKILDFQADGLPFEPLVNFAKNLMRNPSNRAVNELFQFLEKNDHPITEDGKFIAYRKVRSDFKDIYTGKMDNSVGNTVEMPRNKVNEDSNQTCSHGLHVANWDYSCNKYGSSTDTMLEVEVDPADVVAIPSDYNQSKMRVCRFKVLSVVDKEHSLGTKLVKRPSPLPTPIDDLEDALDDFEPPVDPEEDELDGYYDDEFEDCRFGLFLAKTI